MDTTRLQEALNAVQAYVVYRRAWLSPVPTAWDAHDRCHAVLKALDAATPPAAKKGRSESALIKEQATLLLDLAACAVRAVVDLGYPIVRPQEAQNLPLAPAVSNHALESWWEDGKSMILNEYGQVQCHGCGIYSDLIYPVHLRNQHGSWVSLLCRRCQGGPPGSQVIRIGDPVDKNTYNKMKATAGAGSRSPDASTTAPPPLVEGLVQCPECMKQFPCGTLFTNGQGASVCGDCSHGA